MTLLPGDLIRLGDGPLKKGHSLPDCETDSEYFARKYPNGCIVETSGDRFDAGRPRVWHISDKPIRGTP